MQDQTLQVVHWQLDQVSSHGHVGLRAWYQQPPRFLLTCCSVRLQLDRSAGHRAAVASVQADPPMMECSFAMSLMLQARLSLRILKDECNSAENPGVA